MNTESYRGKTVTIKSTGEKGIIEALTHRRSGIGALSARFIVKLNDSEVRYECMPHEVTIEQEITNA
jgi:hypothetical protein